MQSKYPPEMQAEMILLINRYFTSFALGLTGIGIALSRPTAPVAAFCIGLLAFTGIFNHRTARMAHERPEKAELLARLRLGTNLGANCLLVYLLGAFWPPIWLLFVLTPVATAIYSSRAKTVAMSAGVSALLIASHAARGLSTPVEWAQAVAQAAFVSFLALFVNRLSELVHAGAEERP